ncbi:putative protein arginine N-methyltransferase 3 [Auxenochlorella protothecoides]|uniref:type I protein arginine methyltransferase n=1 Tax=Auxenochlorella protothecoides TaxID=3075 RepID=A0A087SCE0_AUXPR|nr:putative protein arginine N-methyltransferase 3 [Auxenochlorella protothecoides]KFM23394.1 putative protein arginine N-methyltransferase 3 [Auxenochlorella protothecoides]RMZ55144.1 hypothetical protein APUTEX25_005422 [Auxenochlorella protothecoides]|eukprot:RMZ55144.1 hypothetical protein APUTEX25_005422 [Auxenochlorella protothecoides]
MSVSEASDGPEEWSDWEESEEGPVKSLFSDTWLPTVEEVIKHDSEVHGFDLSLFRKQENLDTYGTLQLINYIRGCAGEGAEAVLPTLATRPWADDAFFLPTLAGDGMLSHDWDEEGAWSASPAEASGCGANACQAQEENAVAMRAAVLALQAALLDEPSTPVPSTAAQGKTQSGGPPASARVDAAYFESYSFFDIHRDMLSDKARTEAYQAALEQNPQLMQGARVLDVGCGTGILSMFAARAGASRVVGVDGSSRIAEVARQNVLANGLGDRVSIVSGRVEAVEELDVPGSKVDVLVSEWMGYALLFESMLDSVLAARDRFLVPGGAILPDQASIYVAGGGPAAGGLSFWDEVYGFSMAPVKGTLQAAAEREALVRLVRAEDLVTEPQNLHTFDLATMSCADQDFSATFQLRPRPGSAGACHAIVVWFDTAFSLRFCKDRPVVLDTSPTGQPTHWAQTILVLREALVLDAATGQSVCGRLSFNRNKAKHRSLDITLQVAAMRVGQESTEDVLASSAAQAQLFTMGVSSGD